MVLHYIAMRYGGKQSTDADMVNTLIIGAGDAVPQLLVKLNGIINGLVR